MLLKTFAACALLAFSSATLRAGGPPVDNSRADSDGPHVFYRGHNIVVKTIERKDTTNIVHIKQYAKRESVLLTCSLPNTRDQFTFPLKRKLRVENDDYGRPARMLVVSDIEGNFPAFKTMLLGARVINENFEWTFGKGHLVLVGDFFDRGLNVTECLWLIYKLESEADDAGGKVHFILGNHEVMNLAGHYGYVRRKYMENAVLLGEEYARWYDQHSELGRWLRTKNAVEKIGDYVFCHGGISPELAKSGLDLTTVNVLARENLGKPDSAITNPFAQLVFDTQVGIFWYRAAAKNLLTDEEVSSILNFADAKRMIIGHTLVPDVTGLYGGRVICTDLYHDEHYRQGFTKTLYIEDGYFFTIDHKGEKAGTVTAVFKKD